MRIRDTFLALGVILALGSQRSLAQPTYRLTDVGTLVGGTSSYNPFINASGQVTGTATTTGGLQHAFLWDGTTMVDLGTLGGTYSEPSAINASGQVTGVAATPGNASSHAFLWNGTTMLDLGISS